MSLYVLGGMTLVSAALVSSATADGLSGPSLSLRAEPATITVGEGVVRLVATAAQPGGTPTGTVGFYERGSWSVIGTSTIDDLTQSASRTVEPTGTREYKAEWDPGTGDRSHSSTYVTVTVLPRLTVTASPTVVTYNKSVTLKVTEASATAPGLPYLFEKSTDGGKKWVTLDSTTTPHLTVQKITEPAKYRATFDTRVPDIKSQEVDVKVRRDLAMYEITGDIVVNGKTQYLSGSIKPGLAKSSYSYLTIRIQKSTGGKWKTAVDSKKAKLSSGGTKWKLPVYSDNPKNRRTKWRAQARVAKHDAFEASNSEWVDFKIK